MEEVTHGALESTVEVSKDKSLRLPQGLGFAGQLAVHPYLSHVVQPFAGTLRQLAKGVDDERSEEVSTLSSRDAVAVELAANDVASWWGAVDMAGGQRREDRDVEFDNTVVDWVSSHEIKPVIAGIAVFLLPFSYTVAEEWNFHS